MTLSHGTPVENHCDREGKTCCLSLPLRIQFLKIIFFLSLSFFATISLLCLALSLLSLSPFLSLSFSVCLILYFCALSLSLFLLLFTKNMKKYLQKRSAKTYLVPKSHKNVNNSFSAAIKSRKTLINAVKIEVKVATMQKTFKTTFSAF